MDQKLNCDLMEWYPSKTNKGKCHSEQINRNIKCKTLEATSRLLSTDQLAAGVHECATPPYFKSDVRDLKKRKQTL